MPYCFARSSIKFEGFTRRKMDDFNTIWVRLLGRSQLSNPSDLHCSRWWDWWSQLQLASSRMAAAEATGSEQHFCMVSRASTELIFSIHRDCDVRNNVCKPRRLVCECCPDISAWKSRVMKPTVLRDPGRMKPTEYRDEANWFSSWADEANCW